MSISLKLLDSVENIEKKINSAIADKFNDIIQKGSQQIIKNMQSNLIPKWINSQPEIQALLSGDLVGQFGITLSSISIINSIINAVVGSTSILIKKYNNKLQGGGLEINVQPEDFNNLLSLSEGHTIYENGDLHWLEWLLLRGDEIIIVNYEYNPKTGLGRSKLGNMIPGKNFRIPPQYSGTAKNNFITRALSGPEQEQDINILFKKMLGV